jgi:hypothetical protein
MHEISDSKLSNIIKVAKKSVNIRSVVHDACIHAVSTQQWRKLVALSLFTHARINAAQKHCIQPGTIGKVTYTQTVRAV